MCACVQMYIRFRCKYTCVYMKTEVNVDCPPLSLSILLYLIESFAEAGDCLQCNWPMSTGIYLSPDTQQVCHAQLPSGGPHAV